ncbi:hypothetical protein [Xanthobacter aminoxidans]|uniref:hypothetical protein n=1 Tax=Xanthobacter aminoxidans TaxID=186280 RepID=UPI002022BEAC|nr:hypothetical protein [Xanthobacter aminoxidans]MCL8385471.1 hypothetical protein [Xanthobacter aminoxidans]
MIFIKYDNRTGEILSVLNVTRLEDALAAVRSGREELLLAPADLPDPATHYVADGVVATRPDAPLLEAEELMVIVGERVDLARNLPDGTACMFAGGPGAPEALVGGGVAAAMPTRPGAWTAEIVPPWPQRVARCRIVVTAGA